MVRQGVVWFEGLERRKPWERLDEYSRYSIRQEVD